ncbi:MAG: helix-turn-helix domain-containing protein [Clostridiales bacterium]|nr:helix-turn-helix domain-containing protein [Clostridiales bacterium]MCD7764044.1 helix-turn-helix domain-containing protein [Lachnospiraceae bacterium]
MRITDWDSNQIILKEFGKRVRDSRIAAGYSQSELAERAGVAMNTLVRLEKGENTAFENVLNVLRALGNLSNVELLISEQTLRATDIADGRKKPQRVSRTRKNASTKNGWVWGEDRPEGK